MNGMPLYKLYLYLNLYLEVAVARNWEFNARISGIQFL